MAKVLPITNPKKLQEVKDYLRTDSSVHKSLCLRNYVFFELGINWGFRVGDMVELRKIDVISDSDFINIYEQKTGKMRQVYINREIKRLLIDYTAEMGDYDYLFPSFKYKDHPIDGDSFGQIIKQACKAVGLKGNYATHTMRKTFGYFWYQKNGKSVAELMVIFNHSSELMTLIYIGAEQEAINEKFKKFKI